jgi:hypothetical protein
VAQVLFIVARDKPELLAYLRQRFAAEEAKGVIEIFMDRREGVQDRRERVQPRESDGHRRDSHRNWGVSIDLRELGCAVVRQAAPVSLVHDGHSRR